ncbi:hypothetical protein [Ruegeria arenilitoris]|nr:hypothetical protein [Ruegeria arenilitoris]
MRSTKDFLRFFRGFLTIPAAISLSGLLVAGIVFKIEKTLSSWGWWAAD